MKFLATHRRPFLLGLLLMMGGLAAVLFAQSNERIRRVPVGAVAAQLTGRVVGGGGLAGEYQMLGHLTFVEGLGGAVYAGQPAGASYALFALRTDKFRFTAIPNGQLILFGRAALPDAELPAIRVYYSPSPNRDFAQPDSFSEGVLIATLRTRGIQGGLTPALGFLAQGSFVLESAAELILGGDTINLRSMGEAGTVTLAGVAPSASDFASATALSVPFSGTILAAEGFGGSGRTSRR
jgi:hypothetical protein